MISMIYEGEERMDQIGQASPARSMNQDEVRRSMGEANSSMKKSVKSSLSQISQSNMMKKVVTVQERGMTYGKKISGSGRDEGLRRSLKVDFSYGPSDALKDISAIISNKESVPKSSKINNNPTSKQSKVQSSHPPNSTQQTSEQNLRSSVSKQKPPTRQGNSSAIRQKKQTLNEQLIMSLILLLILLYLLLIIKNPTIRSLHKSVIQPFFSNHLSLGLFK